MEAKQHQTVGRYFRAHGDIYLCIRYVRATGFFMRCIQKGPVPGLGDRPVGYVADVSERAIGRTFHCIYDEPWDSQYQPHEAPCECSVCLPK